MNQSRHNDISIMIAMMRCVGHVCERRYRRDKHRCLRRGISDTAYAREIDHDDADREATFSGHLPRSRTHL